MTLPVPLGMVLETSKGTRVVSHELRGLWFRDEVPGGHAAARCAINRSLARDPEEIAYYGDGSVIDLRNGNVVWDGRQEDPGRSAGDSGEVYQLSLVGGAAHAQDRVKPHVFVDTVTEDWEPAENNVKYLEIQEITSSGLPAILQRCPEGTFWTQNDYGEVFYGRLVDCGQRLARVSLPWDAGTTTANNTIEVGASVGVSDFDAILDWATWDIAGGTLTAVITTDWSAGTDYDVIYVLALRGGGGVAVGNNAAQWFIPRIRSVLWNKSGSERTAASNYTSNDVRAHEIVEDLLGRILDQYDGANAVVETDSFDIDQLAYREAVTAADIFGDLMTFHPTKYWAAWARNRATGKHRFEWVSWPTTVRYDIDLTDGFDAPGSAVELNNRVTVRYIGGQGRTRHRERTLAVPLLDDAGLTRQGYIDLKTDAGSEANAIRAGDEFLAEHAIPYVAGTAALARPIYDRLTGMTVEPWEVKAGSLIRVRGVQARRDALNATSRDGVSVFKLVAREYDADSAHATLELDASPVTLSHLLARKAGPRAA